jgi:hypothetical protein
MSLQNFIIESKSSIKPRDPSELSNSENKFAMSRLSSTERKQLGNSSSSKSKFDFVPEDLWPSVRDWMMRRSFALNPMLKDPNMTAYTPGETLELLRHPLIKAWHSKVSSFKIPDEFNVIAFVPCAKTKPWAGATKGIYKSYNKIKDEYDNVYVVTVSEPLGVVPMEHWGTFPQYDNPGLFKDPAMRSDTFTRDWEVFGQKYIVPFDTGAYDKSIKILSDVISSFLQTNKRDDRKVVSFVQDQGRTVGTHTDMLNRLSGDVQLPKDHRFLKRGCSREMPDIYMNKIIAEL